MVGKLKMTNVNLPVDENLPDGVQRTASDLHMRFVQQATTSMETTTVPRQQEQPPSCLPKML